MRLLASLLLVSFAIIAGAAAVVRTDPPNPLETAGTREKGQLAGMVFAFFAIAAAYVAGRLG